MVPSTATRIFRSFLCEPFQFDTTEGAIVTHRYLHDDLGLSCKSTEYSTTRSIAWILIAVWPIGVPLLYTLLLHASREALFSGVPTRLTDSTSFLWAEYKLSALWWEPFEMCRKLVLTGWVLLIEEDFEQARVLIALLFSIIFLALHLSISPLKHPEDNALTQIAALSLVFVYISVLLIKSCDMSSVRSRLYAVEIAKEVCRAYGLGETEEGPFLFFLFFGLSLLLLQLVIACFRIWIEGNLPNFLLIVRAHSIPVSVIFRRVLARWIEDCRRRLRRSLGLDAVQKLSNMDTAILQFRKSRGWRVPEDAPRELLPVATGNLAELFDGEARVHCFVQVDLIASVVRWAKESFISLHVLEDVHVRPGPGGATDSAAVLLPYNDCGGISRVLELRMREKEANEWVACLQWFLNKRKWPTQPAHIRWAQSCMEAASARRGVEGIGHAELPALLKCANAVASSRLSPAVLDEGRQCLNTFSSRLSHERVSSSRLLGRRRGGHGLQLLDAQQVTGLLLYMSTSSRQMTELFGAHATEGMMQMAGWLDFVRSEQLATPGGGAKVLPKTRRASDQHKGQLVRAADARRTSEELLANLVNAELAEAQARFERVARSDENEEEPSNATLNELQFALQLLSPQNDAVVPHLDPTMTEELNEPFSHYWTSASHNSYVLGDQITGRSSADTYRRQLLQGCRQLEIDCWDGKQTAKVTHGNTLMTSQPIEAVAQAIAECAFVTCELPVVLSLEMHCSPSQQFSLTNTMVKHMGDMLLPYAELVGEERAQSLSPADLKMRILLKGKVRAATALKKRTSWIRDFTSEKNMCDSDGSVRSGSVRSSTLALSGRSLSRMSSALFSGRFLARRNSSEPPPDESFTRFARAGSFDASAESMHLTKMEARQTMEGQRTKSANVKTDGFYASYLSLRSTPASRFMADNSRHITEGLALELPITSMSEPLLLKSLGLSQLEQDQIMSLGIRHSLAATDASPTGELVGAAAALTDQQISTAAIVRLAADPPPEVGALQRRTVGWLLRPYPAGARFSGTNMSPLPGWLAGAQSICLNFSPINGQVDLAVQLHFALFNGSQGYVLKPDEMLLGVDSARSSDGGMVNGGAQKDDERGSVLGDQKKKDDGHRDQPYWPPGRELLHRTTIEIISLHNLPKRGEQRPRYDGRRSACHKFEPELSGKFQAPSESEPSSPAVSLSLHPIGGACMISKVLPPLKDAGTEVATKHVDGEGMSAAFSEIFHCLAAEPGATILRVAVIDRERIRSIERQQEVAFETAVLGRLRGGYRVLQLRSMLGTRIELCYLFVRISFGSEPNMLLTPRQLLATIAEHKLESERLRSERDALKQKQELVAKNWKNPEVADRLIQHMRRDFILDFASSEGDVRIFDGFSEISRRLVFPYGSRMARLPDRHSPLHVTILSSGLVDGEARLLYSGGKWTQEALEAKSDAELLEIGAKHGVLLKDRTECTLALVGKPRDPALSQRALITFPFHQSMQSEAAAEHMAKMPNSNFVWTRKDGTVAVVHCWPVKYDDTFKATFTCSEYNPSSKSFSTQMAREFKSAMRNQFGPVADRVPLVYAQKTTHNASLVLVGSSWGLLKFLRCNPQIMSSLGIDELLPDGFVASRAGSKRKAFTIPPEGISVVYVQEGREKLACTKPLALFESDCTLGPELEEEEELRRKLYLQAMSS